MELLLNTGNQLGLLLKVLNEKDRGNYILTIVLKMAHNDKKENKVHRMVAC